MLFLLPFLLNNLNHQIFVRHHLLLQELYQKNKFIETTRSKLTDLEISLLPVGAKMMTLESGVRFLTDYLNGDIYFQTHYPDQNLDRCRTQFQFVRDMDAKWDYMNEVVEKAKAKYS